MAIYINSSAEVRINNKSHTEMFNRGPLLMIFNGTNQPTNWTGGDPYDVINWNTFFDLPTNGTPFDSVTIEYDGNLNTYTVKLFGTGYFVIKSSLFSGDMVLTYISDLGHYVFEIYDIAFRDSIITYANFAIVNRLYDGAFFNNFYLIDFIAPEVNLIDKDVFGGNNLMLSPNFPKAQRIRDSAFKGCSSITSLDFPSALTIGDSCFRNCSSITYINLPICNELGSSAGDNAVFRDINGQTITANFNYYLKTLNGGAYDGDIQYLIDPTNSNTVTITWIG